MITISYLKTCILDKEVPSKIYTPIIININKNISNENIYTWYIFATEIFKEVELLIKRILKILTNPFYLSRIQLYK
jgi:hypothetical protein